MDSTKVANLAGALRTVLAAALGFVVAKGYVPSDVFNDVLLWGGTGAICWWSIATNQATVGSLFSTITGALRNLLTTALTYAAGRGWIGQDQVGVIVAAVGTIAAYLWSSEAKYLGAAAKRAGAVLMFALLFAPALMLGGCSTLDGFLAGSSKGIGDGLNVVSGFQVTYINNCVTTVESFCAGFAADAKKASADASVTAKDLVATYEANGNTAALLAQLLVDATDLQGLVNGKLAAAKARAGRKSIDILTAVTIAEQLFQVGSDVYAAIQQGAGGYSNAQLDALVTTIADQNAKIQSN